MAAGRLPTAQSPRRIRCRSCDSIAMADAPSIFSDGGWWPWWAKDIKIGARCINAMAETVAAKPAFRDAFERRQRCIVPVDAFYEWKKTGTGKQPYAFVPADGLPLAMAGLWDCWKDRASGDTVQ